MNSQSQLFNLEQLLHNFQGRKYETTIKKWNKQKTYK